MPEHPSTEPALENNRIYKMKTTYDYKMPRHPLHGFHHMDFQNLGNSCSVKWYPAGHSIVPRHPHFIEGAFRGYYIYIHTRDCSPTGPTSPFQRVIFNITNPNNAKGKSLKIFPKICYLMFDPPKMGPIYIMTP